MSVSARKPAPHLNNRSNRSALYVTAHERHVLAELLVIAQQHILDTIGKAAARAIAPELCARLQEHASDAATLRARILEI